MMFRCIMSGSVKVISYGYIRISTMLSTAAVITIIHIYIISYTILYCTNTMLIPCCAIIFYTITSPTYRSSMLFGMSYITFSYVYHKAGESIVIYIYIYTYIYVCISIYLSLSIYIYIYIFLTIFIITFLTISTCYILLLGCFAGVILPTSTTRPARESVIIIIIILSITVAIINAITINITIIIIIIIIIAAISICMHSHRMCSRRSKAETGKAAGGAQTHMCMHRTHLMHTEYVYIHIMCIYVCICIYTHMHRYLYMCV